jgi:hypothetical protein
LYCLPYGMKNPYVEDIAKTLGIIGICSLRSKPVSQGENLFDMPRVSPQNMDMIEFSWHITRLLLREAIKN